MLTHRRSTDTVQAEAELEARLDFQARFELAMTGQTNALERIAELLDASVTGRRPVHQWSDIVVWQGGSTLINWFERDIPPGFVLEHMTIFYDVSADGVSGWPKLFIEGLFPGVMHFLLNPSFSPSISFPVRWALSGPQNYKAWVEQGTGTEGRIMVLYHGNQR